MKPASTQTDRNLNFDGIGEGSKKASNRFAGNKWSGHSNDGREVNFGRGPTTGNNGSEPTAKNVGASVTKDTFRRAPTSGGAQSDTKQYRGVGGTTVKCPPNPDRIRAKQTGGPDYGAVSKGSKPDVAGGRSSFNYGPKSQY